MVIFFLRFLSFVSEYEMLFVYPSQSSLCQAVILFIMLLRWHYHIDRFIELLYSCWFCALLWMLLKSAQMTSYKIWSKILKPSSNMEKKTTTLDYGGCISINNLKCWKWLGSTFANFNGKTTNNCRRCRNLSIEKSNYATWMKYRSIIALLSYRCINEFIKLKNCRLVSFTLLSFLILPRGYGDKDALVKKLHSCFEWGHSHSTDRREFARKAPSTVRSCR